MARKAKKPKPKPKAMGTSAIMNRLKATQAREAELREQLDQLSEAVEGDIDRLTERIARLERGHSGDPAAHAALAEQPASEADEPTDASSEQAA